MRPFSFYKAYHSIPRFLTSIKRIRHRKTYPNAFMMSFSILFGWQRNDLKFVSLYSSSLSELKESDAFLCSWIFSDTIIIHGFLPWSLQACFTPRDFSIKWQTLHSLKPYAWHLPLASYVCIFLSKGKLLFSFFIFVFFGYIIFFVCSFRFCYMTKLENLLPATK